MKSYLVSVGHYHSTENNFKSVVHHLVLFVFHLWFLNGNIRVKVICTVLLRMSQCSKCWGV